MRVKITRVSTFVRVKMRQEKRKGDMAPSVASRRGADRMATPKALIEGAGIITAIMASVIMSYDALVTAH